MEPEDGSQPSGLLPIANTGQTRRDLVRRLLRRRWRLAGTLALLLAGTASGLTAPALLGRLVDAVSQPQPNTDLGSLLWGSGLAWITAALVAAAVAAAALTFAGARALARLVQEVLAELREEVFAAAVELPVRALDEAGSSDVVSRVTRDVEAVSEAGSEALPKIIGACFTIVLTVAGLAILDYRLAIAGLLCLPIHILATRQFLRGSKPVYSELRVLEASRGQAILEAVHGAATVVSRGEQQHHLAVIAERSERAIERQRDGARLRNRFYGWLNTAEFVGLAAILVTGFWLVSNQSISIGAATAAALYFHRLFDPIGNLLTSLDDVQRAVVGLARLVGISRLGTAESSAASAVGIGAAPGIRLRDLHFSYPHRPAIRGISLDVPAGARVALVGTSGSGKSTLARLIAGILEPQRGELEIAGRSAAELRQNSPGSVYLVSQEVHLFTGSVAENLRLAAPRASQQELLTALDRVGAGWVHELAEGLETVLGASGLELDDGAAQHLALARVLLANPALVVLDEATAESGRDRRASLDQAVSEVVAGRTSVTVAHRLDQAREADLILVMQQGRVIEQGSHQQLVAAAGEYARLWSAYATA
ncbi:hypothetical protein UM93_13210 [Psychromicrobium lacuslunae]|uniref:ABC transporter ATP-binding protein n=1 Tax=Psychromicrobium lacuslunae TaxID=1618207 RepID=A0A0D4C3M1_9MICC|nr:hypothetical protein UM93_13210 [Psychromicrobium lacuslunae]